MYKINLAKINLKISWVFWMIAVIISKFAIPDNKNFDTMIYLFNKFMNEARFYRRLAEQQMEEFISENNLNV